MNRRAGMPFLFLAASLTCASVGGAAEPAGPRVLLRLKLEKEKTYEIWRRSVRIDRRKVGEVEEQTAVVLFLACRYEVADVDADGAATATLTVPRVRAQIYSTAGAVEYDSAEEKEPPPAAASFAVLAKARFRVTLSPAGEIMILEGAPALLEAALATVPAGEGKEREVAIAAMRERFGEKALAQIFSPLGAALPAEAVPAGGTWERSTEPQGLGLPTRMTGTYTLLSHGGGRSTVAVGQKFERDPEAKTGRAGSISGTGSGRLVLDAATGWLVEGEVKQDLRIAGTVIVGRRHVPATTTISIKTRLGPTAASVAPKPVPASSPAPEG